jgi:hypothetical protein
MRLLRTIQPDFSLDEVIENVQRESDAAVLTARAALGAAEDNRKLDIPRRFPDVLPRVAFDVDDRRPAAPERNPPHPV